MTGALFTDGIVVLLLLIIPETSIGLLTPLQLYFFNRFASLEQYFVSSSHFSVNMSIA